MVKTSLSDFYWISEFNAKCGNLHEQTVIGCDGLVTLVLKQNCFTDTFITNQFSIALPKRSKAEAAKMTSILQYFLVASDRNVQITDVSVMNLSFVRVK